MNDSPDVPAIDPEEKDCGPFSLAGAIIRQAVSDLADADARVRIDAREFLFTDGRLDYLLERVPTGITADMVRRRLGVLP